MVLDKFNAVFISLSRSPFSQIARFGNNSFIRRGIRTRIGLADTPVWPEQPSRICVTYGAWIYMSRFKFIFL